MSICAALYARYTWACCGTLYGVALLIAKGTERRLLVVPQDRHGPVPAAGGGGGEQRRFMRRDCFQIHALP